MEMKAEPSKNRSPKDAALHYLSYCARTAAETEKYLKKKEFSPQEIAETVDWLIECNILSDAAYCIDYIRFGAEKGKGPVRLAHELRERGIEAETVAGELEAVFGEGREKEYAARVAEKLLPPGGNPEQKDLARIARNLAAKGFHGNVIWDVLGRLQK